jgi:hypothetical protein
MARGSLALTGCGHASRGHRFPQRDKDENRSGMRGPGFESATFGL